VVVATRSGLRPVSVRDLSTRNWSTPATRRRPSRCSSRRYEVIAGVKQALQQAIAADPSLRMIPEPFMQINQAMGIPTGRPAAAAWLHGFVEELKSSGEAAKILARNGRWTRRLRRRGNQACFRSPTNAEIAVALRRVSREGSLATVRGYFPAGRMRFGDRFAHNLMQRATIRSAGPPIWEVRTQPRLKSRVVRFYLILRDVLRDLLVLWRRRCFGQGGLLRSGIRIDHHQHGPFGDMLSPGVGVRRAFHRLSLLAQRLDPDQPCVRGKRRPHHRCILRVQPHHQPDVMCVLTEQPQNVLGLARAAMHWAARSASFALTGRRAATFAMRHSFWRSGHRACRQSAAGAGR